MVYVLLADGFEELEMVAPVDMLRRAGVQTALVYVGNSSETSVSSVFSVRKITVQTERSLKDVDLDQAEAIFLPGGTLGVENLSRSETVRNILTEAAKRKILIAAICAAPSLLGKLGLLKDRVFTCYPGCEAGYEGRYTGSAVELDGKFLTGKGAGVAIEFGAALVAALKGKATAVKVCEAMQTNPAVYQPVLEKWK